ncbi:hypothetical protein [Actinomyces faecalis]|uniref:hypothetical protein n=1 Tax=Actinomyces faecalis TaxID=2722820 RepID=UPI001554D750|nr:hypothetical protein [Actinomyces faecalis]
MSTSTDVVGAGQFTTPGVVEQKIQYARTLAGAGMIPDAYKNQPQNIFAAIEYGQALGMAPIEAVMKVNVIKGRASLGADAMAALVRRAGHRLRVTVDGPESVTAVVIRADDPDFEFSVTWDRAKAERAGLWGQRGPWSQYPDQMLRNRAISEVCRQAASDALAGVVYTPEEVESIPDRPAQGSDREAVACEPASEPAPPSAGTSERMTQWVEEQLTRGGYSTQTAPVVVEMAREAGADASPEAMRAWMSQARQAGTLPLIEVVEGEIVEESES